MIKKFCINVVIKLYKIIIGFLVCFKELNVYVMKIFEDELKLWLWKYCGNIYMILICSLNIKKLSENDKILLM